MLASTPSALSSQSISAGNTPTALPTPGTAGQYNSLQSSQLLAGSNPYSVPINQTAGLQLLYNPQVTNTNTNSNSSFWNQFFGSYPSSLASTAGNLIKGSITPPGYTPGGAPLAGGQLVLYAVRGYLNYAFAIRHVW